MKASSISIALCTYNGGKHLREQLESIAVQTRQPTELIVCDDRSIDETVEVVELFGKSAPFPVRIFRNERRLGFCKNFEKAIGLSEGDQIALSDQDDIWFPKKLEKLSRVLDQNSYADYVVSDATLIDEEGRVLPSTRWRRASIEFLGNTSELFPIEISTLIRQNIVSGSAMMIRSSLKPTVLPISELWCHDYWIAMLVALLGRRGLGIKESLMKYRLHGSQAIGLPPTWKNTLSVLKSTPKDLWAREAEMFRALRETIRNRPDLSCACTEDHARLLDQKIAHLINRDSIHSCGRPKRVNVVLKDVLKGRYKAFSYSWKSALRDLLFS